MSYRAFKKLLGETSLERKCRFVLGTISLVLITGSFWFYAWKTEKAAYNTSSRIGPLLISHTLYELHDEDSKSRAALKQFQAETEDRSPRALANYTAAVIKPFARSPAHQADPLVPDEPSLIEEFVRDPQLQEETRFQPNSDCVYCDVYVRDVHW